MGRSQRHKRELQGLTSQGYSAAPTDITLTPATIAAAAAVDTTVGVLAMVDPQTTANEYDVGRFTLTTHAKYKLHTDGKTIKVKAALAEGTDTITVSVRDLAGNEFSRTRTITVTA